MLSAYSTQKIATVFACSISSVADAQKQSQSLKSDLILIQWCKEGTARQQWTLPWQNHRTKPTIYTPNMCTKWSSLVKLIKRCRERCGKHWVWMHLNKEQSRWRDNGEIMRLGFCKALIVMVRLTSFCTNLFNKQLSACLCMYVQYICRKRYALWRGLEVTILLQFV